MNITMTMNINININMTIRGHIKPKPIIFKVRPVL
jgi:hypothetical protein